MKEVAKGPVRRRRLRTLKRAGMGTKSDAAWSLGETLQTVAVVLLLLVNAR